MSKDQMNGSDPAAAAKAQRAAEDLHAQSFVGPAVICMVNGCQRSLPMYGIERLTLMLAACIGKCMGEVLSIGDLVPVMKHRQRCLEIIEHEMKKVKIQPMPQGPKAPAGSVPPETAALLAKLKTN